MTTAEEEVLLVAHDGLVKARARRWRGRAVARLFATEELVAAGREGLLHAIRRFDPSRGRAFSTYATRCIDGFMLTALDDRHPLGRNAAKARCTAEGGALFDAEVAYEEPAREGARREVQELLAFLPERQATVLRLRYLEGLGRREIGLRMGVSATRVLQLENGAVASLRRRVGRLPAFAA